MIQLNATQRLLQSSNPVKQILDQITKALDIAKLKHTLKGEIVYVPRASTTLPKLKNLVAKATTGEVRSAKDSYGGHFVDIADKAVCILGVSGSGEWYVKVNPKA